MIALWPLVRPEGSEVARCHQLQCRCCGPPMPAPRIAAGPNGMRPGRMSAAAAFCVSSSVARSSLAAVLDGLPLLFGLLAHLADERKSIGWAHLGDGLWIDAFARRLHRRRGVLHDPDVLAPGRTLGGRNAELGLQLIDVLGIGEARTGRPHSMPHHAMTPHSLTHVLRHSVAHSISALAMHERGPEAVRSGADGLRQGPSAHQGGCDRDTADRQSFLLHVCLQFLRKRGVRC